jgi:hypothetical protein
MLHRGNKLHTTPRRRDVWKRAQAQRESKEEGKRGADVACTAADHMYGRAGLRDASVNGRGEAPMECEEREAVLKRREGAGGTRTRNSV